MTDQQIAETVEAALAPKCQECHVADIEVSGSPMAHVANRPGTRQVCRECLVNHANAEILGWFTIDGCYHYIHD